MPNAPNQLDLSALLASAAPQYYYLPSSRSDMASETENTLLSQLPTFSRIVTPDATIYIKQGDGVWYRWADYQYGCAIQLGQFLPTGTQAFHMQDDSPRYVKYCHDWLTTRPDRAAFASNRSATA
ncbi:hypothetical protein GSI_10082 [Ganoderma sinense ZZ0214-1]|uniref:Uncharacterized protein n=1 Tax=Ganoderma sinense ZZ0214-1 TaxID=1077348 RepID=A0A2G8RZM8_9APHY|nr:hypothetical protein GSI_10082 [Ganoderma sinense ZZ0214-1]